MNGRIATVLKWGLIVIFVLVLGYSMTHGTGSAMMIHGPVEGMDGDTRENTLDILKNTANIDLLKEQVDDLKDVKSDLAEIKNKLDKGDGDVAAMESKLEISQEAKSKAGL